MKINLTYQDRRDNHYEIFAMFTAGEYWYKFLWDYTVLTYIKEIRYQILNTKTGKTYTTDFQTIFDGSSFYGHGRARYASYTISKNSFASIALGNDWIVIGIDVKGYEGRWTNRSHGWWRVSEKQLWSWKKSKSSALKNKSSI